MNKINRIIISSVLLSGMCLHPYIVCDTVHAEDYVVELKMETQEIPVNYIDSQREVYLPISIVSNPGISSLDFVVERDPRIEEPVGATRYHDFPFGNKLQTGSNLTTLYTNVNAGYGKEEYYYDGTGLLLALSIVLPQDYAVGDVYKFRFYPETLDGYRIRFVKDGEYYGAEHFRYTDGEIRIIDEASQGIPYEPETSSAPETSQEPESSSEPLSQSQNNQNENNPQSSPENNNNVENNNNDNSGVKQENNNAAEENGNNSSNNSSPVNNNADAHQTTSETSESVNETSVTDKTTNPDVTDTDKISITTLSTVSETVSLSEVKVSETESTYATENTENSVNNHKKDTKNSNLPKIITGIAVLMLSVVLAVTIRKKKRNEGKK
ncbi:MAG: hypothetical protein PUE12_01590 [Oscillospiraceae bacterium]|nr:hypothetical protein [Oscillospiraceae bacterium]